MSENELEAKAEELGESGLTNDEAAAVLLKYLNWEEGFNHIKQCREIYDEYILRGRAKARIEFVKKCKSLLELGNPEAIRALSLIYNCKIDGNESHVHVNTSPSFDSGDGAVLPF